MCFDPCDRVYGVIGLMPAYVRDRFVREAGEMMSDLYPPLVAVLLQSDTKRATSQSHRYFAAQSWLAQIVFGSVSMDEQD
jgi:hypothetical protein